MARDRPKPGSREWWWRELGQFVLVVAIVATALAVAIGLGWDPPPRRTFREWKLIILLGLGALWLLAVVVRKVVKRR